MNSKKHTAAAFVAIAMMLLLILDGNHASIGGAEGIEVCIKVIIPSLFPFFFITVWLNSMLPHINIPGIKQLARILHIPSGAEGLLLLGLIGGYPVGAQAITDSYRRGMIDRQSASILLGYCSNAGPAFIFGVTPMLFSSAYIPWILWFLHILSAVLTGIFLPYPPSKKINCEVNPPIPLSQAMKSSISITASVCGWIIIFKTLLKILTQRINLSGLMIYITGLLELSTGCLNLLSVVSPSIRFILCSVFLSFGGLCVLLQTVSVTVPLGIGLYFHGKIMQSLISILLSVLLAWALFREFSLFSIEILILMSVLILNLLIVKKKSAKKLWKLCQV